LSVRYELVPVTIEQYVERTQRLAGYVSKYRIIETVVRVVVTRVNVELVAPDGSTVVSRYSIPTRYVETEYRRPLTQFLGVVRLEEAEAKPPAEGGRAEIMPVTPAPAAQTQAVAAMV
jgi:hypothetical protein